MEAQASLEGFETPLEQRARESKSQAFERIAPPRVNRALDAIRLVGNCANRADYDYSREDANEIVQALSQAVNEINNKFRSNLPREAFQLKR